MTSMTAASAARSASLTKSLRPFFLDLDLVEVGILFRISVLPARRAAMTATFSSACINDSVIVKELRGL